MHIILVMPRLVELWMVWVYSPQLAVAPIPVLLQLGLTGGSMQPALSLTVWVSVYGIPVLLQLCLTGGSMQATLFLTVWVSVYDILVYPSATATRYHWRLNATNPLPDCVGKCL